MFDDGCRCRRSGTSATVGSVKIGKTAIPFAVITTTADQQKASSEKCCNLIPLY
jgi:hypothetical protein